MTGADLARELRRIADLVESQSRVNGLDLNILDGGRLSIVTRVAERSRKHRKGVPKPAAELLQNCGNGVARSEKSLPHTPSALSGVPSSGVVDDPDPEFSLPVSVPENLKENARVEAQPRRAARIAKPRAERWTRVPAGWEPKPEHRELARCKSVAFDDELANFRDWEFKTPRTDADATFRTWIRRAGTERQVNNRPPGAIAHEARRQEQRERSMETPPLFPREKGLQRIDPQAALAALWKVQGKTT